MDNNKVQEKYINTKIEIKILLSVLWTTIMFLFVYADLKAIYQTGTVDAIIKGEIIGMKINQMFLFSSAILMSLPIIMIILSLIAKPMINRILNISIAALFIIINSMTYLIPNEGSVWYYYVYFTMIEYIICIGIIILAIKWPKKEI